MAAIKSNPKAPGTPNLLTMTSNTIPFKAQIMETEMAYRKLDKT